MINMKTLHTVTYSILVSAIIVFVILFLVQKNAYNKVYAKLEACVNAPVKTDTIRITKEVPVNVYHAPIYISGKPIPQTGDTTCKAVKNAYFTENIYADTLKTVDFDLTVNAQVSENTLTQLSYSKYKLHTKEIITTKTIHDTVTLKVPTVKSTWAVIGLVDFNALSLSGIKGGDLLVEYTYKHNFGLTGGYMYLDGKSYGKIGFKFVF